MTSLNSGLDSIPSAISTRAITDAFSQEEKRRREMALTNKDYYYGKNGSYVEKITEDMDVVTLDLVRTIIKKRCSLLYGFPPQRDIEGPGASRTFIENFYDFIDIDKFLLSVDLMAELTGTGLVMIRSDETNEFNINLMLFDGSSISVLSNEDDPSVPDAVSLIRLIDKLIGDKPSDYQVQRVLQQQIWTNESVITYQGAAVNRMVSNLMGVEENKLDFLPFVPFKGEEVHDQYIGHALASPWRELNHAIDTSLTHLCYMIKMQSATPVTLTGYESGTGIMIHPGRAINLPIGAEANVLDFNPKLTETLEVIKYLEERIYETSSVPKVSVVGGEANSGRELLIKWYPLLQVFNEKAVRYNKYELELANMILKVVGLPPIDNITVDYPEDMILPVSMDDDRLMEDIRLNIRTSVDEVMRRNTDISENDAQAVVLANRDFNNMMFQEDNNGSEQRDI